MRRGWVSAIGALCLLWAAAAPAAGPAASPAPAGRPAAHARVALFARGAWCWFADPRAVRVLGPSAETFVGWISWSGAVTVGAYSPTRGVARPHVVGRLARDDHGSPALSVEPDRRLTVFFSGHDGGALFYRTTLRPEDISAWGPLHRVRSRLRGRLGFTYPNPVMLPGETDRLYLFWRGGDWGQDYATRRRDGTWSPARRLISAPGQRPYVKVDPNGRDTIALAFTNGHPREVTTSIFYAAYRGGSLWHADGRRIIRLGRGPISPRQADLVYNGPAAGIASWVWDVAIGATRHPVILYATFPTGGDHAYWYARWSGRRWISHLMTFAGPTISPATIEQEYSGGMTLDHANPSVAYLSRKVGGHFRIERWSTANGGYSWRHDVVVAGNTDNVRPVVPRGWAGGSAGLLWLRGDYGSYTTYRTSIAFLR